MVSNLQFPRVRRMMDGRSGELFYEEEGRFVSTYIEMSGDLKYTFLVWLEDIKSKEWSSGEKITESDFERIRIAFMEWAKEKGIECQW
ncbi:MAG: hypothetical protein HQL20_04345 [Candidatus Omnitrophica bacterium]|nr:hypothetical protein [Candidatus Omnitrophota bacterium]